MLPQIPGGNFSNCCLCALLGAPQGAQVVKNPPAMQETQVRSLGQEDPLENCMATCSSILAWRLPLGQFNGESWKSCWVSKWRNIQAETLLRTEVQHGKVLISPKEKEQIWKPVDLNPQTASWHQGGIPRLYKFSPLQHASFKMVPQNPLEAAVFILAKIFNFSATVLQGKAVLVDCVWLPYIQNYLSLPWWFCLILCASNT